jgi:NAD(P)-dependent dehydrogenase (short-subunit alcohol dehydrogenase family)
MGFLYSQLFVTPRIPEGTDFSGQVIIVTGANTGLGKEAARHFVSLGAAKVIIAVRNLEAGEQARQDIIRTTKCPDSVLDVWKLDLSSFSSVESFAERASNLPRLDVLLENAGVASNVHAISEKYERTITVNVISTILLALLLVPKLKEQVSEHGTTPRICIVSSEVHAWTKYKEQDSKDIFTTLSDKQTANMDERYPTSKLMEVLLVRELAPRLKDSGIVMNMINPGLCKTELSRDRNFQAFVLSVMKLLLARTAEQGSRTLVAAAAAGKESHGCYMTDALVDDGALSPFVTSDKGAKAGKELWRQLQPILNGIVTGVTKNVDA